jgi:hypothetical protein
LFRTYRTVGIEQEQNKPITTYTIQGAAVNKDFFAIGNGHLAVENEDNSRPTTCPSTSNIGNEDGLMDSSSYRSTMTLCSNLFPLPPSIQMNASFAPTVTDDNVHKGSVRRLSDPLSYQSTSQASVLAPFHHSLNTSRTSAASNTQPSTKSWKLHPRWVVRLSQLRRTNTAPSSDNLISDMERPRNGLLTSRRFIAKKPRYAYRNE